MGTSLSGLTPATTFDGLLKVGDNDPLTADLKAISTGDGTDTILNLSTTAFKVSGETIVEGATTGEFFKVRNASYPSQFFKIEKQIESLNIFKIGTDDTGLQFYDGTRLRFFVDNFSSAKAHLGSDGHFGIGELEPTSRLHVKGSGATSATTSLLVQNSDGTDVFKVTDDNVISALNGAAKLYISGSGFKLERLSNRYIQIEVAGNTYSSAGNHTFFNYDGTGYQQLLTLTGTSQSVGIGETTPTARLHVKGSGNDNTTTSLLVQNSDGTELFKIQDNYTTQITTDGGSSPALYLNTGSGREGGDGGLSIGSDTTKFNINSRFGNGVINASSSLFLTSSVGIGGNYTAASSGTARLFVKGSGATSATTALLVENSAGTDMLKVNDAGDVITTKFKLSEVDNALYPTLRGDLGSKFSTINHFKNAYLQGYIHITQGTTSDSFSTYNASAKLQVDSTTQGFLPPRMTTTERDAISTPASGLMVYNTTTNKAQCYNGTTWNDLF